MTMKRVLRAIIAATIILILISQTVFSAYTYYASIQVQETDGNNYEYLPIIADIDNDYLSDNGYISLTGLDTRVLSGSTEIPHMLSDDKVLFVPSATGAYSNENYKYTLGNADQPDFPIIVGHDGYMTVDDADSLDGGVGGMDEFEFELDAYVDTDAGANKRLIYKQSAFATYISGATDITSAILATASINPIMAPGGPGNNELSQVNAVYATCRDSAVGVLQNTGGIGQSIAGGFTIYRGYVWFDTSAIPDDALIYSAVLHLRGSADSSVVDFDITIQNGQPTYPTEPLAVGDFDRTFYSGGGGSLTTVGYNAAGDNAIDLNSTGLSWIDVAGVTKFALRSSREINADEPAGAEFVRFSTAATTLTVNYDDTTISVTAAGVASADMVITTTGGFHEALGNALHGDTTANTSIDCGPIYNAQAKLWISMRFKLDDAFATGAPTLFNIFGKYLGPNDYYRVYLNNGDGTIRSEVKTGGISHFIINSVENTWNADQWYHVILSTGQAMGGGAASNGARLRVDNGVAVTNANANAQPNGGNLVFYNYDAPGGGSGGFIGHMANIAVGIDDLTAAEETDLYNGIAPADATDYWYIDEGAGLNITSYGTAPNAGTVGGIPPMAWQRTDRPCWLSIEADGTEDGFARETAVPANGNDWILNQNNAMPYVDYYKHTVAGTLIAWYQPISMIIGTNLDDRKGTDLGETGAAEEDATITWGANPAGIDTSIGSLTSASQPPILPVTDEGALDIIPEGTTSAGGTVDTVALQDNPLYPIVQLLNEHTGYTEEQIWFIGATLIIFIAMGLAAAKIPNHLLLTGIVGLVFAGFFTAMHIYQWWMMLIFGFIFIMSIFMERKPAF